MSILAPWLYLSGFVGVTVTAGAYLLLRNGARYEAYLDRANQAALENEFRTEMRHPL